MRFETIQDIRDADFDGFISVRELQESGDFHQIPAEPGVYLVLRPANNHPKFLAENPGRVSSKHRHDHSYPVEDLKKKWALVQDSIVIYVGVSGAGASNSHLRTRINNLIRASLPPPGSSSHSGGRSMWQIADSADFLVCWKATPDEDAGQLKSRLLSEFKARYDSLPFANRM